MTKRRILAGVIAVVLVSITLAVNLLTTVVFHAGERKWSVACGGPDHAVTYPSAGVYWKDCTAPKQLF